MCFNILFQVTGDRRPEDVYRDFSQVFYNIVKDIEEKRKLEEEENAVLELGDKQVVWIVGGPGSKKHERVLASMKEHSSWSVISVGKSKLIIIVSDGNNCLVWDGRPISNINHTS